MTIDYDTYGRLNSVSDGTDTFSYSFVTNSDLIASVTRPHNLTTDYAYESNRNLIDYVENKYNATSVSKYDYTNDAIGRRTAKNRTGSAFTTTDTITFGYNDRSEVTSAVSDNITAYNYAFAFDNIGNRNTYTVAGTGTTYTANNLNQYTAITQGSTINPTYNADGCITNAGSANGTWNGENRLVEVYDDTAGYKLEFTYDYQGRRVRKKVYTGSSTTSWTLSQDLKFVYDSYKLIEVLDGQNSDAIMQKFIWNGEELLSVYDVAATATYYYFADANKNIGQLMDSSGNIVAKYEYSPFGVQTLSTGAYASTNPFRFSSEYYDSETELVYYNYRYYSPALGRWTKRDPIGEEGGFNLYGMVNNNSINLLDMLGQRILTKAEFKAYENFLAGCRKGCARNNKTPCTISCCKMKCANKSIKYTYNLDGTVDISETGPGFVEAFHNPYVSDKFWGNVIYDNRVSVHAGEYGDAARVGGIGISHQTNYDLLTGDISHTFNVRSNIGWGQSAGGYFGVEWGSSAISNGEAPSIGGSGSVPGMPVGFAYTSSGGRHSVDMGIGPGTFYAFQTGACKTIGVDE